MKDRSIITIVCIVCVTILVCWALYLGYDSVIVGSAIGGMLYIAGYKHREWREKRREKGRY